MRNVVYHKNEHMTLSTKLVRERLIGFSDTVQLLCEKVGVNTTIRQDRRYKLLKAYFHPKAQNRFCVLKVQPYRIAYSAKVYFRSRYIQLSKLY